MSTLKVGTIQDHSNSNNALVIDSSGRVTEPAKPCFAVKSNRAVNTADFTTAAGVPFNEIEFQRGGTIVAISGSGDTTSAVFTAPITGIYQFNFTGIGSGSSAGVVANGGEVQVTLQVSTDNGGSYTDSVSYTHLTLPTIYSV